MKLLASTQYYIIGNVSDYLVIHMICIKFLSFERDGTTTTPLLSDSILNLIALVKSVPSERLQDFFGTL